MNRPQVVSEQEWQAADEVFRSYFTTGRGVDRLRLD